MELRIITHKVDFKGRKIKVSNGNKLLCRACNIRLYGISSE